MAIVTTNLLNTVVAMGLNALRERIVMPRIVNRQYEQQIVGQTRNATVNVAVPAAVATRTVAPAVVPPSVSSVTPTSVPVTLSEWEEAPFTMTDKDLMQVDRGILPMQAGEAVKSLANAIDRFIWGKYPAFYGFAGTGGTTPFATDLSAYLATRRIANEQLMDMEPRFMLIDTDAEANALGLRAFQDASFRGDTAGIVKGQIGEKLGALWLMTQNVPNHTAGSAAGYTVNGAHNTLGVKSVALTGGALGTFVAGDIITFAGHDQTYTVTGSTGGSTVTAVAIEPGIVATIASGEAVTNAGDHAVNLLLHRDAIAFAMAPLVEGIEAPGLVNQAVAIDEESGLSLRLEITRQHKQYQWAFDALWGASVIRPEFGVRLAG